MRGQRIVIALFDDPAFFHHDDPVRGAHGGEAMRDYQCRAILHQFFQRLLNEAFGFGVECGCGFIERSEEHTSELQSLMRISYAVFCLKKKNIKSSETKA